MQATEPCLSSLVFTLSEEPQARTQALVALSARADLELGALGGRWLPAVLTSDAPEAAVAEFEALPGVEFVEIIFVELLHDTAT